MTKAQLIKIAELFEKQALQLLREARRMRALAEKKPATEPDSLTIH